MEKITLGKIKRKLAMFLLPIFRYNEGRRYFQIRRLLYNPLLKKMGEKLAIYPGVFINEPENIEIGDNVSILHFCFLSGYGGLKIGCDVSIASGTKIFSSSHPVEDVTVKIKEGKLIKAPVEIGDNVWIGANVIVTGGVKIGSGVVVGAGAVVTSNLESNGVYAGVPAKMIKKRIP